MGWEMGTLPFSQPMQMDSMQMDNMEMNVRQIYYKLHIHMDASNERRVALWDFLFLFLMWAVMMIAMMTPSILPMVMLFTTINTKNIRENRISANPFNLLFGYLISWVIFSLLITLPQYGLHKAGLLNPMMEPTHAFLGLLF